MADTVTITRYLWVDVDPAEMGAEILQSTGNERALLPWQRATRVSGRARQSRDEW